MLVKLAGIKCLMCGDVIYSRANHDFKWCSCGNCYVDAGPAILSDGYDPEKGFMRIGWTVKDKVVDIVEIVEVPDKINPKHCLFQDWNHNTDKYGLVKDDKYTEDDLIAAKAQIKLLER